MLGLPDFQAKTIPRSCRKHDGDSVATRSRRDWRGSPLAQTPLGSRPCGQKTSRGRAWPSQLLMFFWRLSCALMRVKWKPFGRIQARQSFLPTQRQPSTMTPSFRTLTAAAAVALAFAGVISASASPPAAAVSDPSTPHTPSRAVACDHSCQHACLPRWLRLRVASHPPTGARHWCGCWWPPMAGFPPARPARPPARAPRLACRNNEMLL